MPILTGVESIYFLISYPVFLSSFILTALFADLHSSRIPNRLIITFTIIGLIQKLIIGIMTDGFLSGVNALFFSLARGILVVALLFGLYLLRGLGAGDIKLYGVIGIYKGVKFSIMTFAAGIVICAIFILISIMFGRYVKGNKVKMMPSTAMSYFLLCIRGA